MWWILALVMFGYVGFTAGLLAGLFGALGEQLSSQPDAPQLPPGTCCRRSSTASPRLSATCSRCSSGRSPPRGSSDTRPSLQRSSRRRDARTCSWRSSGVGLLVGALFGVIGLLASMGIGAPILSATGSIHSSTHPRPGRSRRASCSPWRSGRRSASASGCSVPSQVAVIVIVLAFTQFVEPILRFGTSIVGVDSAARALPPRRCE